MKGLTGPAQVMTRITCERRGPNTEPVINFLFFFLLTPYPFLPPSQKIHTHVFFLTIPPPTQSLTIPVNIRVTDANDNSPIFRNATYSVNISEVNFLVLHFLTGTKNLIFKSNFSRP